MMTGNFSSGLQEPQRCTERVDSKAVNKNITNVTGLFVGENF